MLYGNFNYLFFFCIIGFSPFITYIENSKRVSQPHWPWQWLYTRMFRSTCFSSTLPPPPHSNTPTLFFIEKDRRQQHQCFSTCVLVMVLPLTELLSLSVSTLMVFPTYWSGKRGVERWERKQLGLSAMFVATFWFMEMGFQKAWFLLSCYQLVHFNSLLLLEYIRSVLATWYKFLPPPL